MKLAVFSDNINSIFANFGATQGLHDTRTGYDVVANMNFRCMCFNPRDRVFDLLSLFPRALEIQPYYNEDVLVIYEQFLGKVILHTLSLDFLQLTSYEVTQHSPSPWPLWLVDFRRQVMPISHSELNSDSSAGAKFIFNQPALGKILVHAFVQEIAVYEYALGNVMQSRVQISELEEHRLQLQLGVSCNIFRTRTGYVGTGDRKILTGDLLAVLAGCKVPFILRRSGPGDAVRAAAKDLTGDSLNVDDVFKQIELV